MYLVYVDDYGHTGADLANSQQPIYMLFAVLVPEKNWAMIEAGLWAIITEIADKTGQDLEGFELHAKDFFNGRNKTYNALTFEEKCQYLSQISQIITSNDCKCIATHVIKSKLQILRERIAAEKVKTGQASASSLLSAFMPHPMTFSRLMGEIDNFSKLVGQNTIIVLDHQEEYSYSNQMNSHHLYRNHQELVSNRILDMPFDGDGRYNIMLQISDLLGWAFGRHLKNIHLGAPNNTDIQKAISSVSLNITSIDALHMPQRTDMPLAFGIFMEYAMHLDGRLTGSKRVSQVSQLLKGAVEDAKKKGKENSNE